MVQMPRGEPRSVPDPEGDLYDQEMGRLRAQRQVAEDGSPPAIDLTKALHDFQSGPRIPRPNTLESFIPVVGPAWEAVGDLQDGNYGAAIFNGGMAVLDAVPIGTVAKGLNAARKGIGVLKRGSVTANAARKVIRRVGMASPGQEIHHTIPLNGLGRNVQDWRNHYAFLKVLPTEVHRRLTGSWAGQPMYGPIARAWHGTTDWMKTAPVGVAGYVTDAAQNLTNPEHE